MISPSNEEYSAPQYLHEFKEKNVIHLATLENDQYYAVITADLMLNIYFMQDTNQSLFQMNLSELARTNLFAFRTYPSNMMILMFRNQFVCLRMNLNRVENRFEMLAQQILPIPQREKDYSLEYTPDRRFLILKQSLNFESNPDLFDLRLYTCDNLLTLTPIKEPITYVKSKLITGGKINAFLAYACCSTRSELFVAHQGFILRVRLPSTVAELDIRSNHHSWMRHSLTLYNQTTEKWSLSLSVTSLAVHPVNDSFLVSGADDGTIVIWYLLIDCKKDVLESVHTEQVRRRCLTKEYVHRSGFLDN